MISNGPQHARHLPMQRSSAVSACNYAILVVCSAITAGCGRGDRPDLGSVSGTVMLDGAPLADAYVQFLPEKGRPSTCRTDANGRYTPVYIRSISGACLGRNAVFISTLQNEPATDSVNGKVVPKSPERVPARYNVDTQLEVDVQPGSNRFDFELKTRL